MRAAVLLGNSQGTTIASLSHPIKEGELASFVSTEDYNKLELLVNQMLTAMVVDFFKGNEKKAGTWMVTKNPLLGNVSPLTMINNGRQEKLFKFIKAAKDENGW